MHMSWTLLLPILLAAAYEESITSELKAFYAPDNRSLVLTAKISRPKNESCTEIQLHWKKWICFQ